MLNHSRREVIGALRSEFYSANRATQGDWWDQLRHAREGDGTAILRN
jgi:hypothetical protein